MVFSVPSWLFLKTYCDFSNPNWDQDMPEEVADFLQNEYENYLMWQEEEKSA